MAPERADAERENDSAVRPGEALCYTLDGQDVGAHADVPESNLEEIKVDLDRQRFEFERQRFERENRFFNKNFGIIITAVISISAVTVSALQAYIAYSSSISQLENDRQKNERAYQLDLQKSETAYALEIAKFLMEKRSDITSTDISTVKYIRQIVVASFPGKIVAQISYKMRDLSEEPAIKEVWDDTATYIQTERKSTKPVHANPEKITADTLLYLFDPLKNKKQEVDELLAAATEFNIKDRNDLAIFLAFVLSSSNFLRMGEEAGFSQTSASRIKMIFGRQMAGLSDEEISALVQKPEEFFERIYGGDSSQRLLGNAQPGDGYKYRGRGYLMTTGRANYRLLSQGIGIDLEADPDKLARDSKQNARAAAFFYARRTEQLRGRDSPIELGEAWKRLTGGGIDKIGAVKKIFDQIQGDS